MTSDSISDPNISSLDNNKEISKGEHFIRDVSDTALWVASFHAQENLRKDALFRNPLAARLVGKRGPLIANSMPNSRFTAWSIVIRTVVIDQLIQDSIQKGVKMIVNLGAGLDTRPYRLSLPADLHWVEIDFPHMMEYKKDQLKNEQPNCQIERVSLDLTRRGDRQSLLSELRQRLDSLQPPIQLNSAQEQNDATAKILVLTEGVLPYLKEDEVASLAEDILTHMKANYWIVDYFSPEAIRYFRKRGVEKKMQNAPFHFMPTQWDDFFLKLGWISQEKKYIPIEGRRYQRPFPAPWWMKFLIQFLPQQKKDNFDRSSAYVLLVPSISEVNKS